ncbi:hypothetical protein Tco_1327698 [Tanacetum coccineum]
MLSGNGFRFSWTGTLVTDLRFPLGVQVSFGFGVTRVCGHTSSLTPNLLNTHLSFSPNLVNTVFLLGSLCLGDFDLSRLILKKTLGVGSGLSDMLRERLDLRLLPSSPLMFGFLDSECCDASWIFELLLEHPSKSYIPYRDQRFTISEEASGAFGKSQTYRYPSEDIQRIYELFVKCRGQIHGQRVSQRAGSRIETASRDKEVNMAARDYDDALVCCIENTIDDHIMNSSVGDVVLKTYFGRSWTLKDVSLVVAHGNKRGSLYMVEVHPKGIGAIINGSGSAAVWFGEAEESFFHNVNKDKETAKTTAGVAVVAQMKCDTAFGIQRVTRLSEAEISHLWTRFIEPENDSMVAEHGLSLEITQSPGGSSDMSERSENSRSFKDSERSDEEDSEYKASSDEGGSETPYWERIKPRVQVKEKSVQIKARTETMALTWQNSTSLSDSWNEEPCNDVHQVGDEIEVEVLRSFNWPLSELITEDGVLSERGAIYRTELLLVLSMFLLIHLHPEVVADTLSQYLLHHYHYHHPHLCYLQHHLLAPFVPTSSPSLLLPFASRREDRPDVTLPPRKRLGIALGPRYEVRESSSAAARPAGGLRSDYGFVATMDREIRRDPASATFYFSAL